MARKNTLEIAKDKYGNNVKNIYTLINASGRVEYYANFMLNGKSYQKKNLTKMFNAKTIKKAEEALEDIKSDIRSGKDPFSANRGHKVREIILETIKNKKPIIAGKDNSQYKKNLESFYNLWVDQPIGHLKLGKVTKEDARKILDNLEGNSKSHKTILRTLVYKVFEDAVQEERIPSNPFYGLDYGTDKPVQELDDRFDISIKKIARKIYIASLDYDMSHRLIFLLSIMTARRIGELHELKFSHINKDEKGNWYVRTTFDITKTGIEEKYPLPEEVVELLPSDILDPEFQNEQLFNFCFSGIFLKYTKMLKQENLNYSGNKKLTPHDNRKLFVSIMTSKGVDSSLADRCISHTKKTVQNIYYRPAYKTRKKVFKQWWKFLREAKEKDIQENN